MFKGGGWSIYEGYGGPARPRRRSRRWVLVLALVPLVGLVAFGVYLGSVLMATQRAMSEVFVPSVRPTYAAEPAVGATAAVGAAPAPAAPTTAPGEPTPTLAPGEPTPTPPPLVAATVAPPELAEWHGTGRLNILLLGVDRRNNEEIPRSDTMILVSIDPVGKRVGMLSIPRDLWVNIPGYGWSKINAAYPIGEQDKLPGGGAALTLQTVERNFKVPIHHFASVDFSGFIKIIDAIGGITVEVPYALKDDDYPADEGPNFTRLYIPAGLQAMDGATALRYARSRHFDTDFGRQRRQQQVLQAIREQGIKLDVLPRLPEMVNLLAGSVRTDLDPKQLPALARLGAQIERDQIRSYGITAEMTIARETPEIFYLEPNWPKVNAALREMLGGVAPSVASAPTVAAPRAPVVPTPRPTVITRPTEPPPPTLRPSPTAVSNRPASTVAPSPVARATTAPTVVPARARVWVRNGTRVPGLAARTAEHLRARGYTIVDVSQDPNAGQYPRSAILVYGVERAEGIILSQVIGLPASAVRLGPAPAPPGTDILVILGDDAAR